MKDILALFVGVLALFGGGLLFAAFLALMSAAGLFLFIPFN